MKRLQRQYMYFCTSKASKLPLLVKVDASEDEQEVKRAEDFEEKYNFRFEQKGSAELVGHARNIEVHTLTYADTYC